MKKKKKHQILSLSDYFDGIETPKPIPTPMPTPIPTPLPEDQDI